MKNIIQRIVSLLCVLLIPLSLCIVTVVAVGINSVTATTNSSSIKQGNYAYCYVYIDSAAELASLDVTVHYDNTKVSIVNTYNSINCTLYDSAVNADNISFNYILDGNGADSKTQLFYFRYRVLNNAEAGSSYFDISVGEAYDSGLNDVAVTGSRCKFTISESVTTKSCTVSSTRTVSSSIDQEFSLNYRFNINQLASGSAVITYDAELFEPVSVTAGNFLNDKITDINTELVGSIYVSFVGSRYNSYYDFLTVTFKTIKNKNDKSEIVMKVTDLCDVDLNTVSCSGYTTTANVVYDDSYIKDAPRMFVRSEYLLESNQILATVYLEENSHLGAGDFVLNFDPELMKLNSYEKKFNPTFFNVNDKIADEGKLKFSIISLEDITDSQTVLTAVFDCVDNLSAETISFKIEGSGLTDSLTNSIKLNFIDSSDYIDYVVIFKDSDGSIISESVYQYGNTITIPADPVKVDKIYTYVFDCWDKEVSATCKGNAVYTAIYEYTYIDYLVTFKDEDGTILSEKTYHYGDTVEIPKNPSKEYDSKYSYEFKGWDKNVTTVIEETVYTAVYNSIEHIYSTVVKQPTCIEAGYTTYTCHCGYNFVADEVDALGHLFTNYVSDNNATCLEDGTLTAKCDRCDATDTITDESSSLGHDMGEYVVTTDPTCTKIGLERSDCSRCDYSVTREINATGHSYTSKVTAPMCTQTGYTTYTCHCGYTYTADEVAALGHSFTNYVSDNNATCLKDGTLTAKCDRCDVTDTITDESSALGHDMGEYVVITDPTCTEGCLERSDCLRCDYFVTREIGHSYTSKVTAPNCTQTGYTTYICHCGYTYTADEVAALGHSFTNYVSDNNATCLEDGTLTAKCDRCDATDTITDEGSALGHDMDEYVVTTDPTCTKIGSERSDCSRCDYSVTRDINATGHSYTSKATAPSCTQAGYTTYICYCGYTYTADEVAAFGHTHTSEITISATHLNEGVETFTCKCGDSYTQVIEKTATHTYEAMITEPTCTEQGFTAYICECGETYTDDYVNATGHTEVIDKAISPTYEKTGLSEGKHCSVCGTVIVEQRVLEKLPTPILEICNNPGSTTLDYGNSIKLTAETANLPEGSKIYWYVDGTKKGEGTTFTLTEPENSVTVTVKIVDESENSIVVNGSEIGDTEEIKVNNGFFQKIIAFFKKLFGLTKTIPQVFKVAI